LPPVEIRISNLRTTLSDTWMRDPPTDVDANLGVEAHRGGASRTEFVLQCSNQGMR
jgi:hypothetical protein